MLSTPVHQVLQLTAESSPGQLFPPPVATYLNTVFAADASDVPAGVTLFYPRPDGSLAQATSNGDQTLAQLAQTWRCECSAIVRATAEHSPGGVFDDAMASYLDGVFSHPAAHVPAGIQLFYRT